jgi:hypothetical protein
MNRQPNDMPLLKKHQRAAERLFGNVIHEESKESGGDSIHEMNLVNDLLDDPKKNNLIARRNFVSFGYERQNI